MPKGLPRYFINEISKFLKNTDENKKKLLKLMADKFLNFF